MPIQFKNNASALLAASISTSSTTIVISAGLGASFPSPISGAYFYATVYDSVGNYEIVKVTAKNVDSFTVVRGQDGTTALAFNAGDGFAMRPNAAVFENFVQLDGNQTITGVKTFSDGINSNVTGNLTGNSAGTHTGPVVGNVTGNLTGNVTGNVTGTLTGNITGNAATVTTLNSTQINNALGYTPYNAASIGGASVNYANSANYSNSSGYANSAGSAGSAGSINTGGGLQNMSVHNIGCLVVAQPWPSIVNCNRNDGIGGGSLTSGDLYDQYDPWEGTHTQMAQIQTLPGSWRHLGSVNTSGAVAGLFVRYA